MSTDPAKICALPDHVLQVARGAIPPAAGGCYIKPLPARLQAAAATTAAEIYPPNASRHTIALDALLDPLRAAGTRFWGPQQRTLTVGFLEPTPPQLQRMIVHHMNAWSCSISFVLAIAGQAAADVRITLAGQGSCFAYLGTDSLHVPDHMPTMALPGILGLPDKELRWRVIHETGHILGFQHKSLARREVVQDIIPVEAYKWFRQTQGWNPSVVDKLLLQPLHHAAAPLPCTTAEHSTASNHSGSSLGVDAGRGAGGTLPPGMSSHSSSSSSSDSVMAFWLPASIMRSGVEAQGAHDLTAADREMCQALYPVVSGNNDSDSS